jgi:hypothetical protein
MPVVRARACRAVRLKGWCLVRVPEPVMPAVRLVAVPLLLAGVVAWAVPGVPAADAVRAGPGVLAAPSSGIAGHLLSVAAISASSAWAVGDNGSGKTLIVRWNGAAWKRVPSPSPGKDEYLTGVAVTSARDAWAVGFSDGTSTNLILRWNGVAWKRVASPQPRSGGSGSSLSAVAATSARDAWAVGDAGTKTFILRWNGRAWKPVR